MKRAAILSLALVVALTLSARIAQAAPGDELATITVPVPSPSGIGVSVAADCEGNLFYTNYGDPNLHKIAADGTLIETVPLTMGGTSITMGEIAWDNDRELLWGAGDSPFPVPVYQIDPTTGVATYMFDGMSDGFTLTDGIAYDGHDGTIWHSTDVSDRVDHFAADGTPLGSITPMDPAGGVLGEISGVMVGTGDLFYIGRNGSGEIVVVSKTTGDYISSFATIGGRDEGLECDAVNFAPTLAVWSKDAYDDTITAMEVEGGTCVCGGAPTATEQTTWGRIKSNYR